MDSRAFTLVELLIVAAIFGVIVTVVSSCLVAGIRTWDYARKYGSIEADAMLRLETIQRDVANTYRFYAVNFAGGAKEISFPGLVEVDPEGGDEPRPGIIKYRFDAQKKMLVRKSWKYPTTEPGDEQAESILSKLNDVTFSYCSLPTTDGNGGVWQEGWDSATNFPGAFRMDLSFEGDGDQPVHIRRTVILPAAAAPQPEPVPPPTKAAGPLPGR